MWDNNLRKSRVGACALAALVTAQQLHANAIDDAIQRAADRLVLNQAGNGSWTNETDFSGPIVAGLLASGIFAG